jgi:hypothetical protein
LHVRVAQPKRRIELRANDRHLTKLVANLATDPSAGSDI